MSVRKEKKGDPIGSFKGLSSQTRALSRYEQGRSDWWRELKSGDHVVCKKGEYLLFEDCVYRIDGIHFDVFLGDSVKIKNILYPPESIRPATPSEIAPYERYGRPVDINTHPDKDNASTGLSGGLNEKYEPMAEAKSRYPKGTKFRSAVDDRNIGISSGKLMFILRILTCETEDGSLLIVRSKDGKWAEVIEEAKSVTDDEFDRTPLWELREMENAAKEWRNPDIQDWYCLSQMNVNVAQNSDEAKEDQPTTGLGNINMDNFSKFANEINESTDRPWLGKGGIGDLDGRKQLIDLNSIQVVSSRPSVIPFKEDKHIEINILKRNINI